MSDIPRLSKSRFVAGWQCPKLLWWRVHEKDAPELQPDKVLEDLFSQGQAVGERARLEWPAGFLITGDRDDPTRIARTRDAIDAGATVLFEACFFEDDVFCAVDVLERRGDAWTLVEVKSTTSLKDYHVPDVAVQVHVLRRAGLNVTRAELMHLNSSYRHAHDAEPLFVREDVTAEVEALLPDVPARVAAQLAVLRGPLPQHDVGEHCWFHRECAFFARCWPDDADHIRHLCGVGPVATLKWIRKGVHRMRDIPPSERLNDRQKRQLRAQRESRLIVEPQLREALAPAIQARRLGFLDFETVMRAMPVWDGLRPWGQTAAQFSYHERDAATGVVAHFEFLADGPADPASAPDDPREPLARAMLAATANADLVVMYTSFERTRIRELALHLPHLAEDLEALIAKLWDLKPAIDGHTYHPDFRGSFSLKYVLSPLVPELSYHDLVIVDGRIASVEIARLLFVSGRIPAAERERTRRDLLDYCERDTFATVRLFEELVKLA
jgi:hypothetical protein